MFNSNTKEMKTVFLLEENAYIDLDEYESGYWDESKKYVFRAITSKKESVFTGSK